MDDELGHGRFAQPVRLDEALVNVARAIRSVHDASAGFSPSADAEWQRYETARRFTYDCVGHHDLAPWIID